MNKEYYVSNTDSDFWVKRPNGGTLTLAANEDNAKYICAELNRLLHRIRAPKYDPCRLFRKGDKVRMVEWHGRSFFDGGCHPNCNKWTVTEDETSGVNVEQDGYPVTDVPACFLELVTPVEEVELFYVCENTESKSFEVRRKEDHKVQAAFYYFNKDDTHAKSEAAKATLEHCDRLNADNRKEHNMADAWNDFLAPNYYTARVHISKYWATVEKYEAQGWIEYHTDFDGKRAIITFKRKENSHENA